MLKKLKQFFDQNANDQQPDEVTVQLAAATLMFELIRSDGSIDEIELEQMKSVLSTHFQLNSEDVEALIEDAKHSAESATSLQNFTRKICDNWGNDQRAKLLEYLWILALSDDHIDAHERHLVRKIAGLLYLTDRQINVAREAAKRHLEVAK